MGGDVVSFEHMREFHVAYTEYEQQMKITKKNIVGGRVLARRRDLVDSASQTMVTDEFYDS